MSASSQSAVISVSLLLFAGALTVICYRYKWTSKHTAETLPRSTPRDIDISRDQSSTMHNLTSSSKPGCSFGVFRDHLRRTGSKYLSGDGVWSRRGHDASPSRFHPSICVLQHGIWYPRDQLVHCLRTLQISYIVILGDSNAWRFFHSVRRSLAEGLYKQCMLSLISDTVRHKPL